MSLGSILYIEDSESQRKSLKKALEYRGFSVEVAGDVETARSLFEQLRGQIDVIALDMRLEDHKWPQMTGADVAIEYYNPHTPDPPEFLIHSAYSEADYYKLALQLRATTYLDKSEYSQDDLIRHVRGLVIRRAIDVRFHEVTGRIQRIVEASPTRAEVIIKLCRDELEPVFSGRMGTPFVFLITEDDNTYCYASEPGFPKRLDLYKTIQEMIRPGNPFIVDADRISEPSGYEEKKALERFNAAAFIPLTIADDLRLSIGLLTSDPNISPLAEHPAKMASVLARQLTPNVIKLFLIALKKWTERITERNVSMQKTGEVCLSVGRDLRSILPQLTRSFPQVAEHKSFQRLQCIAEELQYTGSIIDWLVEAGLRAESGLLPVAKVNQIIKSEWVDLDNRNSPDMLTIHGGCEIDVAPGDLSFMVSSVLEWFAQRLKHTPSGIEPDVAVRCRRDEKGAELIFEDRSARLGRMLREHLFTPFTESAPTTVGHDALKESARHYSSLFLAKFLMEARYNGVLENISDLNDRPDDNHGTLHGNIFRMYFPDLQSGGRK
jgi:CheY-like chemotaxis protein